MTLIAPLITSNPQTITGGTYANLASLINTRRWRLVVTPTLASTAFTGGVFHVIFAQPNGGLSLVDAAVELDDSGDNLMISQPITWSAGQAMTFTVEMRAGARSLTIAGATTGNGTFSISNTNPIIAAATNLEIGNVGGSFPFAGTVSSFDDTSPEMSWAPHLPPLPNRRPASAALLAAALAAPPFIPVVPAPPLAWAPAFPDFAPRPRAAPLTGGAAAPTTVIPDPGAPPLSWMPEFPDAAPRTRAAPLAAGAVAPVATLPDAAAPPLAWAPRFPDLVPRARAAPLAAGAVAPVATIPDAPAPALSWSPRFPDRIAAARAAPLASGGSAPAKVIPDSSGVPILGSTVWRQKANTTAPTTGTLTTLAVYPAWVASNGYTILLDARVTNAGNAYECATSGTSASSGGPTTTPAPVTNGAISDGTAAWNFLAAGNGAFNTQVAGSMFLVSLGRGADHSSGTAPRDNNSNTYSLVGSKTFFAGFPNSSASTWVSSLPATGSVGHTISADWGAGDDGGGDEISIMGVEVPNGLTIVDHSSVEANPVSNVCTSNPVTTTGPAVLVCFTWLNGGTHADGFLHVATPGSGFVLAALASGLLEIGNTAGQVQGCVMTRTVSSGGTYTASVTTAAGEGAVMQLVAIQGSAVDPPSAASWLPRLPDFGPRARQPVNTGGMAAPVARIPDVPPMAWAPSFPDRAARAPAAPSGGPAAPVLALPDAPPLSWSPTFPDLTPRARAAPIASGAAAPLSTIPDAPPISWISRFPDMVPARRGAALAGGTGAAPVLAIPDNAVPALSWAPGFPDAAPRPRAAPLTGGGTPPTLAIPDPTPLSWAPTFPDAVRPRALVPAGGLAAPVLAIPNPAATPLSWSPSFPDSIRRARAAPIAGGAAAPVATLPDPPAPALSWWPRFTDRVIRSKAPGSTGLEVSPFTAAISFAPPLVELAPIVTVTAADFLTAAATARDILTVLVDNMTTPLDLTLLHGETRIIPITLADPDTGLPVDLTTGKWQISAIEYQIKPVLEGPDPPLLSKSLAAATITLTAGSVVEQIKILIDPADTPSIPAGRYVHDAVVLFASGARLYVIKPRGMQVAGVVNQL